MSKSDKLAFQVTHENLAMAPEFQDLYFTENPLQK